MDLWGRFLTFDDVRPVRGVVDELVAMRTFLDSVFPFVILKLSPMTSNKVTGITAMLTWKIKIHAIVILITCVTITMWRNWIDTFIIGEDHLLHHRQSLIQPLVVILCRWIWNSSVLDRSILRQPGQKKFSPPDVRLSGEIGVVFVDLSEPGFGLLEANHALVALPH